jgi:membrane protease YdiL (CAAX protease family)
MEVSSRDNAKVLLWILTVFVLALSVRIPSVLLFGVPYEKTPLIYLIVLIILVFEKTDLSAFGLKIKRITRSFSYGLVFFLLFDGIVMGSLYLLIYALTGQTLAQTYNVQLFLLTAPFMTFCVGLSEEALFRGYMQTHFEKLYSLRKAILVQAILFGIWHFVWNLSPFEPLAMIQYMAATFFIGLFFGYFYSKTRNLIPLIIAHGLWDSVPQGIVENKLALDTLSTIPLASQLLTISLPYVISTIITFLFIRSAVKEI